MVGPVSPRLVLGCAQLGNLYRARSEGEAAAILEEAWDAGIRQFDTAPHYGLGLSERRLGAFLRDKPRDQFTVSTKVGRLWSRVRRRHGATTTRASPFPPRCGASPGLAGG
jgi:aryl-alcohol dehydrogenase-like predicted oxidoreductase